MEKTPYYITTAIAYTSGKPHIGNIYEIILTDAIARFKTYQGFDVLFQTGTDEHGQKIEQTALEKNKEPQKFVDEVAGLIDSLFKNVNVKYDKFIRTTDDYHVKQVQKMFKKLYNQGDIYKGFYEGNYCMPCETFWTSSQLIDGKCPDCGREVVKAKEDAYFFKMSKYADKLLEYYNSNPDFIYPVSRKNEMINNFLKVGLQDLCVSRSSFKWGIPVDFDDKHVVYVWIDALTNYITGLGYDCDGNSSEKFKKFWPADLHVVGKDIIRFHTIYWPIILMALGLPLPKKVYGHGWLLQSGEKMSKSKGNVIYSDDLVEVFGVDAVRYYVLSEMGYEDDGLIGWDLITERTNSDLANVYGNLVSRTIAMSNKYFNGEVENTNQSEEIDNDLIDVVKNAKEKVVAKMDELKISDALSEIFKIFKRANKYIDETMPWSLAKDENKKSRLSTVMYNLVESIIIGTSLLKPFMPESCEKVLNALNVKERESNNLCEFGLLNKTKVAEKLDIIFPRLDVNEVLKKAEIIKEKQLKEFMEQNVEIKEEVKVEEKEEVVENKKPEITFDDFDKIDLRVGKIIAAEKVENADKLLKFTVKLGEEERTILSGVAPYYTPEYMLNKSVVVVANLKPRKIRGIESKGMILYAFDENYDKLLFVTPEQDIASGTEVC